MSLWPLKTKSVIKFTTTMLEKFGQNDPHNSNHFYGKPSNIYYKYIVKLTKSSINLTMNRYAQSIVKLAMIFSLFTTFLANPISYVVIFSMKSYNECCFSNLFEIVLTFITQNLVSFTRNLSCPNWRFNQFKRCLSSSEFYYGPNRSHTFTRIFLTVNEKKYLFISTGNVHTGDAQPSEPKYMHT